MKDGLCVLLFCVSRLVSATFFPRHVNEEILHYMKLFPAHSSIIPLSLAKLVYEDVERDQLLIYSSHTTAFRLTRSDCSDSAYNNIRLMRESLKDL